jgi:hypothetical protein
LTAFANHRVFEPGCMHAMSSLSGCIGRKKALLARRPLQWHAPRWCDAVASHE